MHRQTLQLRHIFGANVRKARKQREWTQEELAEKAGLHRTYVGSVERGERNVSIDNMERLASALGATVKSLVDIDNDASTS